MDTDDSHSFDALFFPIFQIALNILACCFVLLVIRIIYATQLHRNCKYLLYVWSIGYFFQFIANLSLGILNQTAHHTAKNIMDPPLRFYLVNAGPGMMVFTGVHEIAIASERIYSTLRPHKYYYRSMKCRLLVFSICILVMSAFEMHLVDEGYQILAGAILTVFDVWTLVINAKAVRFCRARYLEIYGNSSLNARYQVKEALDLASAMQPAYVATFIAKNVVNFGCIATCLFFDSEYNCDSVLISLPWVYIEAFFCTGQTLASLFLLSWLLFKHPRLHRNLLLFRNKSGAGQSVIEVQPAANSRAEGDVYFKMLHNAWT